VSDARLAAELAGRAGGLLLDLRARSGLTGRELGARGDAESDAYLLGELAVTRPGDAVLSGEAADGPARLSRPRVWIIDRLDGTREFCQPGRCDWAVHVALCEAGRGITAAAVAQPALGALYASDTAHAVVGDHPPTLTCTPAGSGSGSGTPQPRSAWPGRRACTHRGWTAARPSTTRRTPTC
jgi:3'(2'), 5'-bisphosphate nucleotidase